MKRRVAAIVAAFLLATGGCGVPAQDAPVIVTTTSNEG